MRDAYITDSGKIVSVEPGLRGRTYGTFSETPSGSLHRVKSPLLPMRDTRAEALADLHQVAKKRGWTPVKVEG